jgi:adenine-specific DNA-methyltransferase
MDKLKMQTANKADENFKKLAAMFPNAVTETIDENGEVVRAIDKDVLMQEISCKVVDGNEERYQFTWPDKKKSVLLANAPINKTLRPCREESVDFDNTENLYIEGDNLEVLKLLQETYLGKIKMIYIDPPYNTGNDLVYDDDFSADKVSFLDASGQYDDVGNRLVENLESNGRFHTDWLNFIYPRLKIAKDLLSDEGVIFISIDDNEVTNLKKICDEIFGSSNHCGTFIVNSTPNARDYGHIGKMHEYCLFYAKNMEYTQTNMLPDTDKKFKYSDATGGFNIHPLYNSNEAFHKLNRPNLYYPFYLYLDEKQLINGDEFFNIGLEPKENSVEIYPPKSVKNGVQFVWRWGKEKATTYMNQEIIGYKVGSNEYRIVQKMRHSEKIIRSMLLDTKYSSRRGTAEVEEILNGKIFSFPKPAALLYDFARVGLSEDDYILDFFSGSATTAHAVMQLNAEDGGQRKFIMVQLPEKTDEKSEAYKAGYKNICEIGKERIRRAAKKIAEENPEAQFDGGFRVLKCDSSNMKEVYYNPAEYEPSLFSRLEDNIKEDRTPEDLLFQVMLDLGVLLSSKIEETTIAGKKVFNVEDNYLIACFDDNVTEEVITEIAKQKPYYFVMRDSSMANDSVATNFEQIFAAYSPDTVRKVL